VVALQGLPVLLAYKQQFGFTNALRGGVPDLARNGSEQA
jgi:hypothetical protein